MRKMGSIFTSAEFADQDRVYRPDLEKVSSFSLEVNDERIML
jgi:hypothetical protein